MISMNALAWAGLFIVVGVVLRAAILFLRNNLVSASIIGGVIGFLVMQTGFIKNATAGDFSSIAGLLWSFSFANMGLTLAAKRKVSGTEKKSLKERLADSQFSGICGMGFFWVIPYALTGLLGYGVLKLIGGFFDMGHISFR